MSTDDLNRALDVFERVCDLPADQRGPRLDELCAGDPSLRALVLQMLERDELGNRGALGQPGAGADLLASDLPTGAPSRVGAYTIVREIGRGGMGVVYEAEQELPRRRVALKVIRDGLGSPEIRRRFARETDLLGRLHHPGIAHIYGAGTEPIGGAPTPYFAMELIEGQRLNVYHREAALSHRQLLALFLRVCDAVQYAHQNGVIHRDLKPGNILVTTGGTTLTGSGTGTARDPVGQPKILDFGVARVTDPDPHATLQTQAGQIVGTLAYMSPEQLDGDPERIDVRTDVYAIGAMLYELLAGRPPIDTAGKPIAEAARLVRETEPARLGSLVPELRGDIETIVAKTMEHDRSRRYRSAAELGEDIRRFLADEPILARRAGAGYQLRKFARRNRALVGGVAASFVLLIAGIVGTSIGLASALGSNRELESKNNQLERVTAFQASQLSDIDPQASGAALQSVLTELSDPAGQEAVADLFAQVNPTTAALQLFDRTFFQQTRDAINEAFADEPPTRAQLLYSLAQAAKNVGLPERSLAIAEESYELRVASAGPDSSEALESSALIGVVLVQLKEWDRALEIGLANEAAYARAHGRNSTGRLMATHDRAVVMNSLGRHEEAAAELEAVVEELVALVGEQDRRTLGAIGSLSSVCAALGDVDRAIELAARVLDGRMELYGEGHPETLRAQNKLASWLSRNGELARAADMVRQILETRRRVLGDLHPETLTSMSNYATALDTLGRFEEAEALAREAIENEQKVFGASRIPTLNVLAGILSSMGSYEDAETIYRQALERQTRIYGDSHEHTLTLQGNLASSLSNQGRIEESAALYQKTYEGYIDRFGPNHPGTLQALGTHASVQLDLGNVETAEGLLRQLVASWTDRYGEGHPATANSLFNLGRCLIAAERPDEAEPYCLKALEIYESMSRGHLGTLHSLALVARLRAAQGRTDEAAEQFRRAIERRTEILGPDHPLTEAGREELAELLGSG